MFSFANGFALNQSCKDGARFLHDPGKAFAAQKGCKSIVLTCSPNGANGSQGASCLRCKAVFPGKRLLVGWRPRSQLCSRGRSDAHDSCHLFKIAEQAVANWRGSGRGAGPNVKARAPCWKVSSEANCRRNLGLRAWLRRVWWRYDLKLVEAIR